MFTEGICAETVGILRALVFGAGGACVDLGMGSILAFATAFIACVVVVEIVARHALRIALRRPSKEGGEVAKPAHARTPHAPDEGPIRSARPR